jgi:transposase
LAVLQGKLKSYVVDFIMLLYQKAKQKRTRCDFGRFAVFQRPNCRIGLELAGAGGVWLAGALLMESLCAYWG